MLMRNTLRLSLLPLLAVSLAAQHTTWTSFADRRGHAMARGPNGAVVMFGGESMTSGERLRDTGQLSANLASWSTEAEGPAPRTEHAMAAATVSGQPVYVVFGGLNNGGTPTNTTWRYDGSAWGDLPPGVVPPARSGHSMVTHLGSQTMFLFGGDDGQQSLNDMWSLNPATGLWQLLQVTGTGPSPRADHCMAYCSANQKVYVFGGPSLNDNAVYEFDPAASHWVRKPAVGTAPASRRKAAMAYIDGAQQILLFGGTRAGAVLGDTWLYDPFLDQWSQPTFLQPTPPGRFDHAVSRGASPNKLVLLGGTNNANAIFEATWVWDANTYEWSEELPAPSSRDGAAMAYDSARDRHVVFGGRDVTTGLDLDETWEIDGLNWRRRTPSARPSPRSDAASTYDSARNRTVLFGGRSQTSGDLGDTWEWNGSSWSLSTPTLSPPPVGGASLVYDQARQVSWAPIAAANPTDPIHMWSWNGTSWTPDPNAPPGSMFGAFDTARGDILVCASPHASSSGGIHIWTGAAWRRPSGPVPSPRSTGGMAYDQANQKVVLFGGHVNNATIFGDTWTWDGTSWLQHQPASSPSARAAHALGYHAGRARIILFGGILNFNGPGGEYVGSSETWEWNGADWLLASPAVSPSARWSMATSFAPNRGRLVLFGGGLSSPAWSLTNEVWEYDGLTWHNRTPSGPSPSARTASHIGFDPVTSRVLAYGGWNNGTVYSDTWSWDGVGWTQLSPAANPGALWASALCTAPNGLTILGGWNGNNQASNGVWRWSGSNWLNMTPTRPSSRVNFGCAYDSRQAKVILFGGMSSSNRSSATYNQETWEWNGQSWTRRIPSRSPSNRAWCKLAYDAARSRVVLYGGADATNVFQDTWEWDGDSWTERITATTPPGSSGHGFTYDQDRKLAVAFGGFGTWDYGPTIPASATIYGFGCATSGSNPPGFPLQIKTLPWTGPWLGDRLEVDFENRPALSLGVFVWGFSNTFSPSFGPLPFNLTLLGSPPGCMLRADPMVSELILPTTQRYVSFVLPNHTSFLGAVMYGQAGFIDPNLPGSPVVTSNGLEMVFGHK